MHAFLDKGHLWSTATIVWGNPWGSVVIFCKTLFLISSKSTANLSQKTVGYPSRKGVHYIFFGYHRLYLIIAQNVEKYIMHPFFGGIPNSFLGQISCTSGWNQKKGFTKNDHGPQGFPHTIVAVDQRCPLSRKVCICESVHMWKHASLKASVCESMRPEKHAPLKAGAWLSQAPACKS